MTRKPEPRSITVDGTPMMAVDPQEYHRLAQARRQVGGFVGRLNILKHRLSEQAAILDAIAAALEPHATVHPDDRADPGCLLCAIRGRLVGRPAG